MIRHRHGAARSDSIVFQDLLAGKFALNNIEFIIILSDFLRQTSTEHTSIHISVLCQECEVMRDIGHWIFEYLISEIRQTMCGNKGKHSNNDRVDNWDGMS